MNYESEDDNSNVDVFAALSKEKDTKGFDIDTGKSWHYPINYPLRDYQYNIVQQSLFKNTLVSLPTGLGKTFIAAVVMYNFYRWYPSGKIIFMAPTRPLVKQQVDACYNITAIPKNITAEITGLKSKACRKSLWDEKRVFFITPQILQNDLDIIANLSDKIKCLVFDEAHRAKGNHAYCEVIRKLYPKNTFFRVLALSATPGSSIKDVFEIINNLLIAHLEVRTEESLDVAPYVFHRSLQTVVVPLGRKLEEVRDAYIKVLDRYTRILVENKVINGNCNQLTKGKIFMTMRTYQERNKTNGGPLFFDIMRSLNICITLYHGYELLLRHGLRGFLSFFEDHIDKPLLRGISEIHEILQNIRSYLGPVPNVDPLPDGTVPEIPENITFGHPKYYELGKILMNHFSIPENADSRVIIFCEYKESVMEAYTLLLKNRPVIKPKFFMGQGAMPQRTQMNVINSFRTGEINTLISTCIGEEGLDVGEVDLIVCFDINNKSPIRLVQRMGRTGRKRQGKVVILVTEGREQQTLKECLAEKQNLSTRIMTSKELQNGLFKTNPRMVPAGINPICEKLHMTVTKCSSTDKKLKKEEVDNNNSNHSTKNKKSSEKPKTSRKRVSKEAKSLSQSSEKAPKKCKSTKNNSTDNFKQCDLKSMFSKGAKRSVTSKKGIGDDIIEKIDISSISSPAPPPPPPTIHRALTEELFNEISAFVTINDDNCSCKICDNLFECSKLEQPAAKFDSNFDLSNWTDMDEDVIKSIDSDAFNAFASSLESKNYTFYNDFDMPDCVNFAPDRSWSNISSVCNKSVKSERKQQKILLNDKKTVNSSKSLVEYFKRENSPPKKNEQTENVCVNLDDFFDDTFEEDISNLTGMREQSKSIAQVPNKMKSVNSEEDFVFKKNRNNFESENTKSLKDVKDVLKFLLLEKIEDIMKPLQISENSSEATVIYDLNEILQSPEKSPVLTGRVQSFKLRTQDKSRSENSGVSKTDSDSINLLSFIQNKTENPRRNVFYSSSSSEFENKKDKVIVQKQNILDELDSFCDVSVFGLSSVKEITPDKSKSNSKLSKDIVTNLPSTSQKENFDINVKSPIISQFEKTCTQYLPSQVSITQGIEYINKGKSKPVTSLLKKLKSDDFSDDFCFMEETKNKKSPVTPKRLANITNRWSPHKKTEVVKSPIINFIKGIRKIDSDSDDDFEQCPTKSNVRWLSKGNTQKMTFVGKGKQHKAKTTDSDEFIEPNRKRAKRQRDSTNNRKKGKRKKKKSFDFSFIENEARLDSDEEKVSSDTTEGSDDDILEMSFVNDETQDLGHNTMMHAEYLKSVRSPTLNRGQFKIPINPPPLRPDIFSQVPNTEDNSYLNDSFCDDSIRYLTQKDEMSVLELAELQLEEERKNRKRKKSKEEERPEKTKKRRIIVISSDESE